MIGFCKVFQSILGSSIWADDDKTLRVWIAMLVLKDREHTVKMSVLGLANIARVTVEECRLALEKFKAPDPDSSSRKNEGRKISELPDGGWLILNGAEYAKRLSYEERKEYNRLKMREYRKRKKDLKSEAESDGERQAWSEGMASVGFNSDGTRKT